jgi:hypothetical protein
MTTPFQSPLIEKTSRKIIDDARDAGRSTVALLRNGGYATIGATDAAVAYVRKLGERAEKMRVELPELKTLPNRTELSESLRELGSNVEQRFGALAGRGREVVESLQRGRPARDTARVDVVSTQVKPAGTSAGAAEAAETASDAVEAEARVAASAPAQEAAATVADGAAVDYDGMTVAQLRDLARERGIAGRTHMNRSQLITALNLRSAT